MPPIKSRFLRALLLALCLALAAHSALAASEPYDVDNGEETSLDALTMHKRPSFFVGSRYGRSSSAGGAGGVVYGPSKTRRLSVVPRNDRFFLGSRYGKRADELMSPYEQGAANELNDPVAVAAANHNNNNKAPSAAGPLLPPYAMMSCIYTGHRNYYRCNSVEEINSIINQLTGAQQAAAGDADNGAAENRVRD